MATDMEDLEVLRTAEAICDAIWEIVSSWNRLASETIGSQFVRAADSIGANIAESYGRYNYGEKIQFLYYARGSIYETKYWIRRATQRSLLPKPQSQQYADQLEGLAKAINLFINRLRQQRNPTKPR